MKTFIGCFIFSILLFSAADFAAIKFKYPKEKVKPACENILGAAKEYKSIYFLAPGLVLGCKTL